MPSPELPPSPPAVPMPGCPPWLLAPGSAVPRPLAPGTAVPAEDPECGSEAFIPVLPTVGVSGADGALISRGLPVPGLPGAFGLPCTPLPQAARTTGPSNAKSQVRVVRVIESGWR